MSLSASASEPDPRASIRDILKICRDLAHHNRFHFTAWQIAVAMRALDEPDQSTAVPLADRP